MAQSEQDSKTAPFGPWVTFKNFIGQDLKGKVIPSRIDHTLFRGKSGTEARHVRGTLRFFGLTRGDEGDVTPALRELVEAYGSDAWPGLVRRLLEGQYRSILEGVDLEVGTQGQLEEAFRGRGNVSGSTLRKAVRFYLTAAKEAGIQLSPHFVSVRVGGSENGDERGAAPRAVVQRPRKIRRTNQQEEGKVNQPPSEGVHVIQPLPGRDFRIWIPKDLSQAELDFGMKYLRDYLKLTRGKGEAKGGE